MNVNGVDVKRPRMEDEENSVKKNNYREAFGPDHKLSRYGTKFHLIIGVTGSVATIKLKELIDELYLKCPEDRLAIKIVTTQGALHFFDPSTISEVVYEDRDEWGMWKERGDPVLHIELRKWADALVIAPLDANTMAKMANGICDNLLTSLVRAWDNNKPLFFAPAMNTCMWESMLTVQHLKILKELMRWKEIPPIQKELMCGDKGYGAMASVQMIASIIASDVKNRFAVYSVTSENVRFDDVYS
uniref:Flavoprotein domain-containing protein n=1 Tax=Parastrongyloides trichosuri TaxID=131310 RepID=A0A0N4Z0Y7_PARTI